MKYTNASAVVDSSNLKLFYTIQPYANFVELMNSSQRNKTS